MTYVENEWRINQCQIMMERVRARAVAKKRKSRKAAAGAADNIGTEKVKVAVTRGNNTGITVNMG